MRLLKSGEIMIVPRIRLPPRFPVRSLTSPGPL